MRKVPTIVASILFLSASLFILAEESSREAALSNTFKDPQLQWGPCPSFLPEGCRIAVLHGDPSKPNVDIFLKVPAGAVIPSHTHTSAERMVLVSGKMTVSYEGQAPVTLRTGSYAYGPAMRPHSAVCAKGAACVLFIAFESPLDAMPTGTSGK